MGERRRKGGMVRKLKERVRGMSMSECMTERVQRVRDCMISCVCVCVCVPGCAAVAYGGGPVVGWPLVVEGELSPRLDGRRREDAHLTRKRRVCGGGG